MIKPLLPALVLLALMLVFVLALAALKRRSSERIRLVAKPLMTPAERETLRHLERAAPYCRIHAQVAMGALMRPERGLDRSDRTHWRNRFSQKIVDLVLEDRATGAVVALVELDDRMHDAERDRVRDRMTAACGYLTIRLPGSPRPTAAIVAARVAAALTDPDEHRIEPEARPCLETGSTTAPTGAAATEDA